MVFPPFDDLSNRLTRALLTGDFDLYRSLMLLPLEIAPRGREPYVLTSTPALQQDFDLYHIALRAAGVTDIFREVASVDPAPGNGHLVHCRVHLLARAHRLTDPFGSDMLLMPQDGALCIHRITATADHIDWTLGRRTIGPGSGLI